MADKKVLRRKFKQKRTQSVGQLEKQQAWLLHVLRDYLVQTQPRQLLLFAALPGEAELFSLADPTLGWQSFLPRVEDEGLMSFYHWQKGEVLQPSAFGIPEPIASPMRLWQPQEPCIVLVPALAIDSDGYRLGFGGGFYDRFLAQYPSIIRVGVVWEQFRLDYALPRDAWDVPMHFIATEKGVSPLG